MKQLNGSSTSAQRSSAAKQRGITPDTNGEEEDREKLLAAKNFGKLCLSGSHTQNRFLLLQ